MSTDGVNEQETGIYENKLFVVILLRTFLYHVTKGAILLTLDWTYCLSIISHYILEKTENPKNLKKATVILFPNFSGYEPSLLIMIAFNTH